MEVGSAIPNNTPHAISVCLPTWKSNIGYEEGEDWVVRAMRNGYPRFFINNHVKKLFEYLLQKHGKEGEKLFAFASYSIACRCREFIYKFSQDVNKSKVRILEICVPPLEDYFGSGVHKLAIVFMPIQDEMIAKKFWQHTGDIISSRYAEFCLQCFKNAEKKQLNETDVMSDSCKGKLYKNRYYSKNQHLQLNSNLTPTNSDHGDKELSDFLEQRFGRNLDFRFVNQAKIALRRRIAGTIVDCEELSQIKDAPTTSSTRQDNGLSENDVYLFPCGMSALYNTHRLLLEEFNPEISICYGFPYADTLKVLEKFGPGAKFYGNGQESELDNLENSLKNGEKILALFCEFPSNPLLKSPNLQRIKQLAEKYNFLIVVDETIGNFVNINCLKYADVVVSSLTKIFSGDSNVMGGSVVLNPSSPYYSRLKNIFSKDFEDIIWDEDALFLERNSRNFVSRARRINENAETILNLFKNNLKIKSIFYPSISSTKIYYDDIKNPDGGYGGLLSIVFKDPKNAIKFYDAINTAKGPSLGTNFTLVSPYAILAHYAELDWASNYGVDRNLIRISVGLESKPELIKIFTHALQAADE